MNGLYDCSVERELPNARVNFMATLVYGIFLLFDFEIHFINENKNKNKNKLIKYFFKFVSILKSIWSAVGLLGFCLQVVNYKKSRY